jgi:hypothetical protein
MEGGDIFMAKTLVDLDRDLVAQAMTLLGESTIAGTIRAALQRVIADAAWHKLIDHMSNLDDEQVAAIEEARNRW